MNPPESPPEAETATSAPAGHDDPTDRPPEPPHAGDDNPDGVRGLGTTLDRMMAAVTPNMILLLATCGALGTSVFALVQPHKSAAVSAYKLEWDDRLIAAGVGFGSIILLVGFSALWLRRQTRSGLSLDAALDRMNRFTLIGLALPLLVQLVPPGVEKRNMGMTLLLVVLLTALVGIYVARLPSSVALKARAGADSFSEPLRRAGFIGGLIALTLFTTCFFGWRAIMMHHDFRTAVFDLGLYDNIFYQSWNGNFLACTFMDLGVHYSAHFDPILVLLSPFYALFQSSEFVVVFQAFWVGSAVVPIALLTRHTTGSRGVALVMALSFTVYPAMHGVLLYDFHSLALIVPVIAWVAFGAFTERWILYWVAVAAACLVREDIPLLLCATSFAMIVAGGSTRRRHGALTIVVALAYFAVVKLFVMVSPDLLNCSDGGVCFAYYFKELIVDNKGGAEVAFAFLNHPGYVLEVATREAKLIFLLQLFVPLVFLPFFARSWRWMLGYGITFTLLASKGAVFSIAFQYCTLIFPVAYAAAAIALGDARHGRILHWMNLSRDRTLVMLGAMVLAASVLATLKFGGIIPNHAFRAGWGAPNWSVSDAQSADHAWLVEQREKIGEDARVTLSDRMAPHFSARLVALRFGFQSDEPTDFIVVHERDVRNKKRRRLQKQFEKMKADPARYEVFAQRGPMWIFRPL